MSSPKERIRRPTDLSLSKRTLSPTTEPSIPPTMRPTVKPAPRKAPPKAPFRLLDLPAELTEMVFHAMVPDLHVRLWTHTIESTHSKDKAYHFEAINGGAWKDLVISMACSSKQSRMHVRDAIAYLAHHENRKLVMSVVGEEEMAYTNKLNEDFGHDLSSTSWVPDPFVASFRSLKITCPYALRMAESHQIQMMPGRRSVRTLKILNFSLNLVTYAHGLNKLEFDSAVDQPVLLDILTVGTKDSKTRVTLSNDYEMALPSMWPSEYEQFKDAARGMLTEEPCRGSLSECVIRFLHGKITPDTCHKLR